MHTHIRLNKVNSNFHKDNGKIWIPLSEAANGGPYRSNYLRLLANQKKLLAVKIDDVWHTTKEALHEYISQQQKIKALNRKRDVDVIMPRVPIQNYGYLLNFEEEKGQTLKRERVFEKRIIDLPPPQLGPRISHVKFHWLLSPSSLLSARASQL